MFQFLKKLEDKNMPLLGPNVKALKFWGLLLPENHIKKYVYYLLHVLVILFTITECIEVWFVKYDMTLLLNNLKVSMLATVSCVKVLNTLFWQNKWQKVIDYANRKDLASRKRSDHNEMVLIHKYTQYYRILSYSYWFLTIVTVVAVIIQPIVKYISPEYRYNVKNGNEKYMEVVSSWVPFNKNKMPGYLIAVSYQTFAAIYGGGWFSSFDTGSMGIMIFFSGELQLLRRSCSKIFGTTNKLLPENEARSRLTECARRHAELLEHASIFDSCLSPIMFYYAVVCSIMLCASLFQMANESSAMQQLLTAEYLLFGVVQLFLYCWHGNDVFYMSKDLMRGVYEGQWYKRLTLRKEIILLTGQLSKEIYFSVGPFAKLTLTSFISILKGAYSYYTLISK